MKQIGCVVIFSITCCISYIHTQSFCYAQNTSSFLFGNRSKNTRLNIASPELNISFVPESSYKSGDTQSKILEFGSKPRNKLIPDLNLKLTNSNVKPLFRICDRAEQVTVRLYGNKKNVWGSGVILDKVEAQDGSSKYYVITNDHVVKNINISDINVLTNDRIVHKGLVTKAVKFNGDDLAVVEFTSAKEYEIAKTRDDEISEDELIYAVGFPYRVGKSANPEFECLSGKVGLVMDAPRTFAEGYRIGYDSKVVPGMSGGGVFDQFGRLVAFNGRPKKIFLFSPYTYKYTQKLPCEPISRLSRSLAWGIPASTVIAETNKLFGNRSENKASYNKFLNQNVVGVVEQFDENLSKDIRFGGDFPGKFWGQSALMLGNLNSNKLLSRYIFSEDNQATNFAIKQDGEPPIVSLTPSNQLNSYLIEQSNQNIQDWIDIYQTANQTEEYKLDATNIKNLKYCQIPSADYLQFSSR